MILIHDRFLCIVKETSSVPQESRAWIKHSQVYLEKLL